MGKIWLIQSKITDFYQKPILFWQSWDNWGWILWQIDRQTDIKILWHHIRVGVDFFSSKNFLPPYSLRSQGDNNIHKHFNNHFKDNNLTAILKTVLAGLVLNLRFKKWFQCGSPLDEFLRTHKGRLDLTFLLDRYFPDLSIVKYLISKYWLLRTIERKRRETLFVPTK